MWEIYKNYYDRNREMLIDSIGLHKDLKKLGIDAKVYFDINHFIQASSLLINIKFNNEEDRNYYRLCGKYAHVNLLIK